MKINLMICTDHRTEVFKSPRLVKQVDYVFVNTDILNPILRLNMNTENLNDVNQCNYFYIPETGRYYFKNDEISVRNGLVEISGHVDVLYTYASHIADLECIIDRNQYVYNTYLNDDDFKVYQNPILKIQAFPDSFERQDSCYVLVTNGTG